MSDNSKASLKAFLIARDVLANTRNSSVISIINIFNELRVSQFPADLGTFCLVAVYGGAPGKYKHQFEIWSKGEQIGDTEPSEFFLEDSISMFHVVSYLDGLRCEEPRQITFKSILDGEIIGTASLGIFKPLWETKAEN